VFAPDPKTRLPHATRYQVTIAASATAVSGRRLAGPYSFSFTTPTVRLLQTNWYRRNGRYDEPIVVPLRFNQPVRAADIASHVTLRYQPHEWKRPVLTAHERLRMGADAARFDAKVAAASAAALSEAPVAIRIAADWDKKKFPPAPDLVVFESTT